MSKQRQSLKRVISPESYEDHQFKALDRAADRLSFLSEASRRLSFALTDQECFQQLLNLMVPAFADAATFSLVTEEEGIKRVAMVHADPEKERAMRHLLNKFPPLLDDKHGPGYVIRTQRSEFFSHAESSLREFLAEVKYPELGIWLRGLGIRSIICVPLEAHGQVLGALWMAISDSGRRFEEEDLRLAEEVANRAALSAYLLLKYKKTTALAEKLQVESEVRESYLSQIRHDALSVLTVASLRAQMIVKSGSEQCKSLASGILDSITRVSEILKKTKDGPTFG